MSDFQGPKKLGMTTIRLRRGGFADRKVNAALADHEITTHRTLPDIVG
jgi:FMN phosphatase YigB (HAD superfamily)